MASRSNTSPVFTSGKTGLIDGNAFGPAWALDGISPLPDGKLIFVGSNRLYRMNGDGSPDTTLDEDGGLTLRLDPDGGALGVNLSRVIPLSNGKFLVTGTVNGPDPSEQMDNSLLLARLNADGSVDTSFNHGQGTVYSNPSRTTFEIPAGATVLPDGRILLAAHSWQFVNGSATQSTDSHISFARYLPDGTPDPTFGVNGVVLEQDPHAWPYQMTVQADGKILVAGQDMADGQFDKFALYRFNSDGTPDTSFGTNGRIETSFPIYTYAHEAIAMAVAVQPDGKIVVAGSAGPTTGDERLQDGFAVVRYNPDGSLDTSFSGDGKFSEYVRPDQGSWTPFGDRAWGFSKAEAVYIGDDGSITLAGITFKGTSTSQETQFALMRLTSDGRVDTTFGANGVQTIAFGPNAYINFGDILVKPDGHILLTGSMGYPAPGGWQIVAASFGPDGRVDAHFGAAASGAQNSVTLLAGHPDQLLNPALSVSDPDLQALDGEGNYAGASLTVARAGGANPTDRFVAAGSLRLDAARAYLDGVDIGAVSNGNGTLHIELNSNATQVRLNKALQSIAYDTRDAPPSQAPITIDWLFSDGNAGSQGSGGPATAKFSTQFTVQSTDVPYWIDALLDRGAARQTADQLRTSLQSVIGSDGKLGAQYDTSTGHVPTAAEMSLVATALAQIQSAVGLGFDGTGPTLKIQHSNGLAAGAGASTPIAAGGAELELNLDGSALARGANVVLHQLAQLLGLKPADSPSVDGSLIPAGELDQVAAMTSVGAGDATSFGPLEIAALQFLYGPSTTARTGNDVYRLSTHTSNFIWDGAGSDTVSAQGLDANVMLHLEPGHWDYIGAQGSFITSAGQITVNYGSVIENAIGGNGNDSLTGTALANSLSGGAGDDRLAGLGGNDTLDGGTGIDTAIFSGARSNYSVAITGSTASVTDRAGNEGNDLLTNVERAQFADGMLALDIDGNAGQAYRLYQAAFGRKADAAGLGYWIAAMDHGMSAHSVANLFAGTPEFAALYGSQADPVTLVTNLYDHTLHRAPDAAGLDWWVNAIKQGNVSVADVLLAFSDSAENHAQVIGDIQNGIPFAPYG